MWNRIRQWVHDHTCLLCGSFAFWAHYCRKCIKLSDEEQLRIMQSHVSDFYAKVPDDDDWDDDWDDDDVW